MLGVQKRVDGHKACVGMGPFEGAEALGASDKGLGESSWGGTEGGAQVNLWGLWQGDSCRRTQAEILGILRESGF